MRKGTWVDFRVLLCCAFGSAAAQLAAIFGSPARVGRKRVPPSTMAGGLRNWVSQDVGLKAWATEAHKQLKSDKYVAALCSALRYAEFVRQISMPGMTFDRVLSHWNLSLPSNGLMLVNALRSASNPRQTLTQELCVLTPPGQCLANSLCSKANETFHNAELLTKPSHLLQGCPETSGSGAALK